MNYLKSIAYIESLSPTMQTPCLERVQAFMEERGNPQNSYRSIHVGGTNGKGSTVAILDQVLRDAGYKVGRYIGPHLLKWNERFHVGGQAISNDRFGELASRIRLQSEDFGRRHPHFGSLTWFEFLTVMAFTYFAEEKVDIAVIEVGLGGRWDATNVLSAPLVSVITQVDLDHTQILGDTVEQIAQEKSGIIKTGTPIVTAAKGAALSVIQTAAHAAGVDLYICSPPGSVKRSKARDDKAPAYLPHSLLAIAAKLERLSLVGGHQRINALVAITALYAAGLLSGSAGSAAHIDESVIEKGLSSVFWPGRMQYLTREKVVLDGAHNPSGARALRLALDEAFPGITLDFVLGCFGNKDVRSFLRELLRPGDRVWACEATSRRAVTPAQKIADILREAGIECQICESVEGALNQATASSKPEGITVVSGSFAVVRDVMLALGWRAVEDGFPGTRMNWCLAACQETRKS